MQSQPLSVTGEDFGDLLKALENYPWLQNRTREGKGNNTNPLIVSNLKQIALDVKIDSSQNAVFQYNKDILTVLNVNSECWIKAGSGALMRASGVGSSIVELLKELAAKRETQRPLLWLVTHQESLSTALNLHEDASLASLKIGPASPQFEVHLEGSLRALEVDIQAKVGALRYSLLSRSGASIEKLYPVQDEETRSAFYVRNKITEDGFVARFLDMGFTVKADGRLLLQGEPAVLGFYASELPRIQRVAEVISGDRWRAATRDVQRVQPKIALHASGEPGSRDWLSLDVAYESSGGFRVPRNEVLRLIRSGNPATRGRDGKLYVLDGEACEEFEEVLQDSQTKFDSGQSLRVPRAAAEMLSSFLTGSESFKGVLAEVLETPEVSRALGELSPVLRPYQMEGVRWMERLQRSSLGGILADDMGLGKTLQALSLLRVVAKMDSDLPSLIVCPTSLLHNWKSEAARFVPEFPSQIMHGDDRKSHLKCLSRRGLVITTYGLISRDLDLYRAHQFQSLILDEASYVRNPDTDAAKALRQIRAHGRFALTGTPVENSVQDLWSVFEIVLPGYLGPRDEFRDRFQKPLAGAGDLKEKRQVMERLRRRINPYLLRRTKREVAKDLPARIEKVVWCELTGQQNEYYQRLLEEGREEVRMAKKRSGQGGARATMFTVLLRLRQICNDLRLLGVKAPEGDPSWSSGEEPECSGKLAAVQEFLAEVRENGGKMLIFSQFTSMLKLLKETLEAANVPYCYLDGSSNDRAAQVASFQQDPTRQAFLISLKAGGYGLNLTAAEHVALIDPWWNPAVEAQAIDRAHRIGQSQPVTAYRFVTRGTVEEKILKLQASKRETAELAVDDDPLLMSGVSDGELESILE
jgi:superfamily II DNA or RNA helicase